MDLHMRPSGGIEAARQIKAQAALRHIPIIATSATPSAAAEVPGPRIWIGLVPPAPIVGNVATQFHNTMPIPQLEAGGATHPP